jgi:hypothetical protein
MFAREFGGRFGAAGREIGDVVVIVTVFPAAHWSAPIILRRE